MVHGAEAIRNAGAHRQGEEGSRRDFLILATTAVGAIGVASVAWPFIDQMNPSADMLALSTTEVDLAPVAVGQAITVKWRGKPVFIRHRTPEEIKAAPYRSTSPICAIRRPTRRACKQARMADHGRRLHASRLHSARPEAGRSAGDYGGWFCPCHGSHYDTSAASARDRRR